MDAFAPRSIEVIRDRCGALFDFNERSVIPSVFLPDVAKRLCDGSLFKAVCSECGNIHLMPYRCLYHDAPQHADRLVFTLMLSSRSFCCISTGRMARHSLLRRADTKTVR